MSSRRQQEEEEQQLQQQQQQQPQPQRPRPPPRPPHCRTGHTLAPPPDLVAAMEVAPDGLGLVAPAGPPHPAGAGGANHAALPRAARARLAHEQPQPVVRPTAGGEDPHAPLHPPAAQLQPLAPQVVQSLGAQQALIDGGDAEVKNTHGKGKGGFAGRGGQRGPGKHVESAAVGPAARGSTQRGPGGPGRQGPAPK